MHVIRRLTDADMPAVTAIVRSLPDHFTSDVPGLDVAALRPTRRPAPDDHRVP
jgi:hypothetical protein